MHHSAPLRFAIGTLLAGGRVVVPGPVRPGGRRPPRSASTGRPRCSACRPTCSGSSPTGTPAIGATPDLSSFRLVAHAGAPCPEWVKRRLIEAFPDGFDVGVLRLDRGAVHRLPQRGVAGAAGHPRPRATRAHDDGRRGRPPVVRRTCLTRGSATSATRRRPPPPGATPTAGPAFTVGDLGRVDEDGYVFLDGRREDLIISGGVNVYPAEVERVLGEVAGVEDIAVFGVEDEQWGQRVCAAVVGAADEEALRAHAREHLAPAKRPKEYHRLDTLPRTPDRQGPSPRPARPVVATELMGFSTGGARVVPRRRGARPAGRATSGCCSSGSTPACGRRRCRHTSRTR